MRTFPALVPALLLASALVAQEERQNPFKPFDRAAFEQHCRSLGATDAAMQKFAAACKDGQTDVGADTLLRELVPALGKAAQMGEDGDPLAALELGKLAASASDLWVRAHARYHLARVMLDNDDPETAAEVLRDYLRDDRNRTPLDAEAAFFFATALADMPMRDNAIAAFADYLDLFPDAPERFRAVAQQRRAELEAQFQSPLHDIADSMRRVERDLKKERTGDPTQSTQKDIVDKLQKIIEELEEQEKKSSGMPSGNGPSSSPAAKSALPGGPGRVGQLGKAPPVGDRWSVEKKRDRDKIEADLQANMPDSWRERIGRYYERLGKSDGKGGGK